MPQVGNHDRFEQIYINKLREALVPVGQLITYESDRAALDAAPPQPSPRRP
jgi:hypothetical protein